MTRRYWDACAFLAWLKQEDGRYEGCGNVLREARAGKLQIVTSALTIAEVLMLKGKEPVPERDRRLVRDVFKAEWLILYNVDRTIAESAQEVVWRFRVHPKDAIHVATALSARVDRLDTTDGDLLKRSGRIGAPALTIARPVIDGQLC